MKTITNVRLTKGELQAMKDLETAVVPFETFTFSIAGEKLNAELADGLAEQAKDYHEKMRAQAAEYGANAMRRTKFGLEAHFDGPPPKNGNRELWVPSPSIGENWYALDTFDKFGKFLVESFDRLGTRPYKWVEAILIKGLLPDLPAEESLLEEVFSEAMSGFSVQAHLIYGKSPELLVHIVSPAYDSRVLSAYAKLKLANKRNPLGDHQFEPCDSIEAAIVADSMRELASLEYFEDNEFQVEQIRLRQYLHFERDDAAKQVASGRIGLKRYREAKARAIAKSKKAKVLVPLKVVEKTSVLSPTTDIGQNQSAAASQFAKRVKTPTKVTAAKKAVKPKSKRA